MAIQNHGIRATTREPLPDGLLVGGGLGMRFRFDLQADEARRESHLRRSSEDVSQPRFASRAEPIMTQARFPWESSLRRSSR